MGYVMLSDGLFIHAMTEMGSPLFVTAIVSWSTFQLGDEKTERWAGVGTGVGDGDTVGDGVGVALATGEALGETVGVGVTVGATVGVAVVEGVVCAAAYPVNDDPTTIKAKITVISVAASILPFFNT
jgi:hypothetical protein